MESCALCGVQIEKGTCDVTELGCGHIFHARCAHGPLSRNFSNCPSCMSGITIPGREDATEALHPLDFGDDIIVEDMISNRLVLLKLYSTTPGDDKIITTSTIKAALKARESQECKYAHSAKDVTEVQSQEGMFSTLRDMVGRIMVSDPGTEDSETLPAYDSEHPYMWMESEIGYQINSKVPAHALVSVHGVDAHYLINSGFRLGHLFEIGYELNDLILFKATWVDMRALGLTHTVWRAWKHKLPIEVMIAAWDVTYMDVYIDVCGRSMNNFASIGFSKQEIRLLRADSASVLMEMPNISRDHVRAMGWTMQDWKDYDLKQEHMVRLQLDPKFITEHLQWGTDAFVSTFGFQPSVLCPPPAAAPPPRTRKQPRTVPRSSNV